MRIPSIIQAALETENNISYGSVLLPRELVRIYIHKYNTCRVTGNATNDYRKSRLTRWRPDGRWGYNITVSAEGKTRSAPDNMLLRGAYQRGSLASCISLIKYCGMCHFDLSPRRSYSRSFIQYTKTWGSVATSSGTLAPANTHTAATGRYKNIAYASSEQRWLFNTGQ
jgi:hypothetical protein